MSAVLHDNYGLTSRSVGLEVGHQKEIVIGTIPLHKKTPPSIN
jgi:hypothetical protein